MIYDVIILGGGLSGVITAIGLSKKSLSVALIDRNKDLFSTSNNVDNRALAISKKSKDVLNDIGLWETIQKSCEPILDILITDENSPITAHYDHKTVGDDPMGYVIDSNVLYDTLRQHVTLSKFDIYSGNEYQEVKTDGSIAQIVLDDKKELTGLLLICAEGKNSNLRKILSLPTIKYNYKQSSIVCNVTHEKKHDGLAVERFFNRGPFAILPMFSGYKSSIVWTDDTKIVKMLMSLTEDDFLIELKKKIGSYLGQINLDNKRISYPLSFLFAESLYKKRVIFLGDAAHSIHPIAGQGFNLGLRDIESIINNIFFAKQSGIDIGGFEVLNKFSRDRYFDNFTMAIITDGINRTFSNKVLFLKMLRNIGLFIINHSTTIKKFFIQHAMGIGKFN